MNDTGTFGGKKNPIALIGNRTDNLSKNTLEALPLSYRRLEASYTVWLSPL